MFKTVTSVYEQNQDIIKQCEGELLDLEHEMELAPNKNARDGFKMYVEMREVRRKRRQAKEENELLKDMYDFLKQNEPFKNRITQIQGSARKLYNTQTQRQYTPRERSDLTITSAPHVKAKPFEDLISDFNRNKARIQNGKLVK